jgi:hypothetical protein
VIASARKQTTEWRKHASEVLKSGAATAAVAVGGGGGGKDKKKK